MITSRRDYLIRIIEEVGRLLAGVQARRRRNDRDDAALDTVVMGFQRLFALDADQIFQLTPDQHFELLDDDEAPEFVRDRLLLYAALCTEAGHIYARKGNAALARATFISALRFTAKTLARFSSEDLPDFAPRQADLLELLKDEPLDAQTAELIAAQTAG